MAKKTMIRQLISKWGVMSTDMVQAMESDNAVMNVSGSEFIPTIPVEEPEMPAEPETVDNIVEEVDIDAI